MKSQSVKLFASQQLFENTLENNIFE